MNPIETVASLMDVLLRGTETLPGGSFAQGIALANNDNDVFVVGGNTARIDQGMDAGRYVNHVGYGGSGSSIDTGKVLAKEGPTPTLLTFDNLINTSRGINGIVFDIDNLPGTPTAADFVFQMSPTGAFDLGANPVGSWTGAPNPSSVSVISGSPDRVSLVWPDNTIEN